MINRQALAMVRSQLSLEYGCQDSDWDAAQVLVRTAGAPAARRYYGPEPPFFSMATFGRNAVVVADQGIHGALTEWVKNNEGPWLFEWPRIKKLTEIVNPFGYEIWLHHMFLPAGAVEPSELEGISLRWIEGREALQPYYSGRWPNALCKQYEPKRPDMLAVAAVAGGETVALAGCSADTADLWQIGIDVTPAWRGRGLGRLLVGHLRQEVEARGKVPFYGTSSANLGSWGIALACGFRPAWVEAYSYKRG